MTSARLLKVYRGLARPPSGRAEGHDAHCVRLSYTILLSVKDNERWEEDCGTTEQHQRRDARRDRNPELESPRPAQRGLARHDRGSHRLLRRATRSSDSPRRDPARQRAAILGRRGTWIRGVCRARQGPPPAPAQDAAELLSRDPPDAIVPAADHWSGP